MKGEREFQAEDGIRDGSSSLVGSEMCIRDSREPDVGFDPRSPGSRPGPKAGFKPCLLYTSDAADDLRLV